MQIFVFFYQDVGNRNGLQYHNTIMIVYTLIVSTIESQKNKGI
jgi:hypothetical protein